jgi:hypothetical protein
LFPQNSCQGRVEIANKVSLTFDKHFCANTLSHEHRCAIRPLVHWFIKKTSNEKESTPKTQRGLSKKTSDEKRGNPKNVKELIKNTSDEKRGNPKNTKGLIKKDPDEKRGNRKNAKALNKKPLIKKCEVPPKNASGHDTITRRRHSEVSSESKCIPKSASLSIKWSKARVTLFGLSRKQQAAQGWLTKRKSSNHQLTEATSVILKQNVRRFFLSRSAYAKSNKDVISQQNRTKLIFHNKTHEGDVSQQKQKEKQQ